GADHLLTRRADAEYAARMIAVWAERFVTPEQAGYAAPASQAQVVVAETGQGMFLNHVVAGVHQFLADEPPSVGGFDAGPSPYDLLAAALGSCTSMTIRMYAQRKGLALDRVLVEVDHRKVHLDESAQVVDGNPARIDRFERHIVLEGDLTDGDRQRLLAIADRCPVHRTLEAGALITTTSG
ncbi:MAG: OsmC family protein, partial [Ilumatobacteraceae bacterium]